MDVFGLKYQLFVLVYRIMVAPICPDPPSPRTRRNLAETFNALQKISGSEVIVSADQCASVLEAALSEYADIAQQKGGVMDTDAELFLKKYASLIVGHSARKDVSAGDIETTIIGAIKNINASQPLEDVVRETAETLFSQISSPSSSAKPDIVSPDTKRMPMPKDVWQDIYAIRNGQLVRLYSLSTEKDRNDIRECYRKLSGNRSSYGHAILSEDLKFTHPHTRQNAEITSWGSFVEFAAFRGLDLRGLALSPEQKKYAFEHELQGKMLQKAQLDNCNLDGCDLTGTDLSSAQLNQASLRDTTGTDVKFAGALAEQIDLTGASYVRPNFYKMHAPRSVHFRSCYDNPVLGKTNWTSSRMVGTTLMLGQDSNDFLNIGGSLVAGCLFYGGGTEIIHPKLAYGKASFPGTAFYNISLVAGKVRGNRADFSPLLQNDPRLSQEEKDHVFSSEWINGKHGFDGLLVSPDHSVAEEQGKKLTVFSEVKFETADGDKGDVLFFSKGPVIERSNFHEVGIAELVDILPDDILAQMKAADLPVIAQQESSPDMAGQDAQKSASAIPDITFDKDMVGQQIENLKKASKAEAMALGNNVQVWFAEASTIVTNWAMAKLAIKSEFTEHLGHLIADFEGYSIVPPEAPETTVVEPEPEPEIQLPPPPPKGFMASIRRSLLGPLQEDIDWSAAVEARRNQDMRIRHRQQEAAEKAAMKPQDLFETKISPELGALSVAATTALKGNMEGLEDVEALHRYLGTLKEVINTYLGGIEDITPSLLEENPSIIKIVEMCKYNLGESCRSLDRLDRGIAAFMDAVVDNGIAVHNVQGKILDLNIHFNKAAALHTLDKVLEQDAQGYSNDEKLAGLYTMVVVVPVTQMSARTQIQEAFMQAKGNIVASLRDAHEVMVKSGESRKAALGAILNPVQAL